MTTKRNRLRSVPTRLRQADGYDEIRKAFEDAGEHLAHVRAIANLVQMANPDDLCEYTIRDAMRALHAETERAESHLQVAESSPLMNAPVVPQGGAA